MKRIILVLSLLAFTATAYAAPTKQPRTAAQWADLCKNAVPAKNLRTAQLVSSRGVAPIRATLAANGLSAYKEESVPDVLVLHEDGITCSYMNRELFYQITRRPHTENGQFVIGDYADGVAFTDPARRVPEGTLWGAKKIGVEVYLPVQLGVCDRDLATCSAAYKDVLTERDALKAQLASGRATSGTIDTVIPTAQPTTSIASPTTPVVAGTVKPIGSSFKARIGFLIIGLAVAGAMLYFLRDRRRIRKMRAAHHQSHHDMHTENVRLRTERNEARDSLANTAIARYAAVATIHERDTRITELGREVTWLTNELQGVREAAAATNVAHARQLAEVRGQRDVAEEKLRQRSTALEHAVTQANNLADDLRAMKDERDEVLALLVELGIEPSNGDVSVQAKELATSIVETSDARDAARAEVGRLTGELAVAIEQVTARLQAAEGAAALEDRLTEGPEDTFARIGIEQRVDDLDARVDHFEEVEYRARYARQVIEEQLGPADALVRDSRSKLRGPAREALMAIRAAAAQLPAPAPTA